MVRQGPRIHRVPPHLDYALIPAPLDITLPASEKSPLPSIIVTPSSPCTPESPFFIAFLPPPTKPSLRERLAELTPSFKTHTTLILLVLVAVVFCHFLLHRLAALSHSVNFGMGTGLAFADAGGGHEDGKSLWWDWLFGREAPPSFGTE